MKTEKRLTTYRYFLLLMWTGRVKLTMIWKQDLAVTKANTEYNKLKNLKAKSKESHEDQG